MDEKLASSLCCCQKIRKTFLCLFAKALKVFLLYFCCCLYKSKQTYKNSMGKLFFANPKNGSTLQKTACKYLFFLTEWILLFNQTGKTAALYARNFSYFWHFWGFESKSIFESKILFCGFAKFCSILHFVELNKDASWKF